jgi:hypothetical protein
VSSLLIFLDSGLRRNDESGLDQHFLKVGAGGTAIPGGTSY